MAKRIEIKTSLGVLCAEVGGDKEYPEIFVYLQRGDGSEVDLVAVGTQRGKCEISAYLYTEPWIDDWTQKHTWTEEILMLEDQKAEGLEVSKS